jgi:CheY-like chemotaxis protein/DNA-directed RNA polymerase specialized sigma24 family protein
LAVITHADFDRKSGFHMTIAQQAAQNLPYLRRYARALTGSQTHGDALVQKSLKSAIANPEALNRSGEFRVNLYSLFQQNWNGQKIASDDNAPGSDVIESNVQENLLAATPISRVALLLTTLEDFDDDQAGTILGLSAKEVRVLANEAIADIELATATDVLIIEDEPLITLQLEALVTDMGHHVCGTPTTLNEAVESVKRHQPGLILADIQLADGSSGIEAVKQILAAISVPVIFITAFPERLLTGERPEPTYLITKPFQENTVKAAIGQAMFLGSTALPQTV